MTTNQTDTTTTPKTAEEGVAAFLKGTKANPPKARVTKGPTKVAKGAEGKQTKATVRTAKATKSTKATAKGNGTSRAKARAKSRTHNGKGGGKALADFTNTAKIKVIKMTGVPRAECFRTGQTVEQNLAAQKAKGYRGRRKYIRKQIRMKRITLS